MTKLSVLGNPKLRVSELELRRKGISYTIDTVRAFRKRFPASELFLIIGSDSLRQFHTWRSPAEILVEVSLLVYRRPRSGRPKAGLHSRNVSFIKGPLMEISSSDIRQRIQRGKSIRYLVRENVLQFIEKRKLYSDTR